MINSTAQCVVISGPPGCGKTLCLLQRAFNEARKDEPGRVILVAPLASELLAKFKKFCTDNQSEELKREILVLDFRNGVKEND